MPTPSQTTSAALPKSHTGITIIATVKLVQGTVLVLSAIGAIELRGQQADDVVQWVIAHGHLAPEGKLVDFLWARLNELTDGRLKLIGEAGLAYGLMQMFESYGLFRRRKWAEWLVVIATSLPVPFELYELVVEPSLVKSLILALNCAVAGYLWYRRADFLTRRQRKAIKAAIRMATLGVVQPGPETEGPEDESPNAHEA